MKLEAGLPFFNAFPRVISVFKKEDWEFYAH
jgi:hypothetical protein